MRACGRGRYTYRYAVAVRSVRDNRFIHAPGTWKQKVQAEAAGRQWAADQGHAREAASAALRVTKYRVYN